MNKNDLNLFLEKCGVSKENRDDFLEGKHIIKNNNHIYLQKEDFSKNQVFSDSLIFVQLQELVPSRYLYEFLFNYSNHLLPIKSEKQVQRILYGRDISIDAVLKNSSFTKGSYYIVVFNEEPLGIVEYLGEIKFCFKTLYHLGQYLKE